MKLYKLEQFFEFTFQAHRQDTGALTDADAPPTFRVYKENVDVPVATGTCAKRDDGGTTGFYFARGQCAAAQGFESGKTYEVRVEMTVGGVTRAAVAGVFAVVPGTTWNVLHGGTSYWPVDVMMLSGDSAAADNLEAACDGTGYNIGGGAVVAARVTAAVSLAVAPPTAAQIVDALLRRKIEWDAAAQNFKVYDEAGVAVAYRLTPTRDAGALPIVGMEPLA